MTTRQPSDNCTEASRNMSVEVAASGNDFAAVPINSPGMRASIFMSLIVPSIVLLGNKQAGRTALAPESHLLHPSRIVTVCGRTPTGNCRRARPIRRGAAWRRRYNHTNCCKIAHLQRRQHWRANSVAIHPLIHRICGQLEGRWSVSCTAAAHSQALLPTMTFRAPTGRVISHERSARAHGRQFGNDRIACGIPYPSFRIARFSCTELRRAVAFAHEGADDIERHRPRASVKQ